MASFLSVEGRFVRTLLRCALRIRAVRLRRYDPVLVLGVRVFAVRWVSARSMN